MRAVRIGARCHQHEIMHAPLHRLAWRHLAARGVAQQGDVRQMRTGVEFESRVLQGDLQCRHQLGQLRRRLADAQPANAVVPPEAGLEE